MDHANTFHGVRSRTWSNTRLLQPSPRPAVFRRPTQMSVRPRDQRARCQERSTYDPGAEFLLLRRSRAISPRAADDHGGGAAGHASPLQAALAEAEHTDTRRDRDAHSIGSGGASSSGVSPERAPTMRASSLDSNPVSLRSKSSVASRSGARASAGPVPLRLFGGAVAHDPVGLRLLRVSSAATCTGTRGRKWTIRRCVHTLERLGHKVTLELLATAA
jgi:hypothetical protein